jgi:uncharacterized protein YunC (DUF1805 family)
MDHCWFDEFWALTMNNLVTGFILFVSIASLAGVPTQNLSNDGTFYYLETLGLAKPLLLMIAPKGFLACGYIDVESCNKTKEACAIVTGVNNEADMKKAEVKKVSVAAANLGIKIGMTGAEALKKMK